MKYSLVVSLIPLALGASAMAQPPMQQPANPDDGVGVDYTQPWMNDLLLRAEPEMKAYSVRETFRFSAPKTGCEKEIEALRRREPGASEGLRECTFEQQPELRDEFREWSERQGGSEPRWNLHRRPVDPSEKNFSLKPVPPVARHPNAQ